MDPKWSQQNTWRVKEGVLWMESRCQIIVVKVGVKNSSNVLLMIEVSKKIFLYSQECRDSAHPLTKKFLIEAAI